MTSSISDIATDHDVKRLVGLFYSRIRDDQLLGPLFDDVAQVDWAEHIPTMCQFWETVLFHRPGYKGNPILPHVQLDQQLRESQRPSLRPEDFEHWLTLFRSTVDELFTGPRAEQAKRGATRMAQQMLLVLSDDHPLSLGTSNTPYRGGSRGHSYVGLTVAPKEG